MNKKTLIGIAFAAIATAVMVVAVIIGTEDRGFRAVHHPGPVRMLVDAGEAWRPTLELAIDAWRKCASIDVVSDPPAAVGIWLDPSIDLDHDRPHARLRCVHRMPNGECPEGDDLVGVDVMLPPFATVPIELRRSVAMHEVGHALGLDHDGMFLWGSPMHPEAQVGAQVPTDADCAMLRARYFPR